MFTKEDVDEFITFVCGTIAAFLVIGVLGALCWWAWASESMVNILTLAGLMALGAGILIAGLLAWLKLTEEQT